MPSATGRLIEGLAVLCALQAATPALARGVEPGAPAVIGGRITITATGTGPDVILIPGLASSAHVWDATVGHLRSAHRVHVVQVAGFAGSPALANATGPVVSPVVEAIHAYITSRKLKKVAVVGHSIGGLVAMQLAITHPEDVDRIMVVDSLPFIGLLYSQDNTVAAAEPLARNLRDRMSAMSQDQFAAVQTQGLQQLMKTRGPEFDRAAAAAASSDRRVVAQAIYDAATTDVRPQLARIQVPVTVLYPGDDRPEPAGDAGRALYRYAYKDLPQVRFLRIGNSRHFIMVDQPGPFFAATDQFLAGDK